MGEGQDDVTLQAAAYLGIYYLNAILGKNVAFHVLKDDALKSRCVDEKVYARMLS